MTEGRARAAMAAVLISVITATFIYRDMIDIQTIETWLHDAGLLAPLLFILLYALATVLFLPGSLMTLAGGALFGPLWGSLYNLVGATLGATLAFLVARHLAADWVEERSRGRLGRLKHGVEDEGWRFVALVRLVPLIPFNLLNYALGLTRIRLTEYVLASLLFMLPGAAAYTWLGYVGREAVGGGEDLVRKGLLALALLAAVALLPGLVVRLRQRPMIDVASLKASLQKNGESPLVLDVRSADEYIGELGHIAGSLNIPIEELKTRMDELNTHADRPIAIVCHTDRRSQKAARLLAKHGFTDVRVVRNGMTAWNAAGETVMRGARHA